MEHKKIVFNITGQDIVYDRVKSDSKLVANTLGLYDVQFNFDSTWDEFDKKYAIFKNSKSKQKVELTEVDGVYITTLNGAFITTDTLIIGCIGYKSTDSNIRYVTDPDQGNVKFIQSVDIFDDVLTPKQLTELEQLRITVDEIKETIGSGGSGSGEANVIESISVNGTALVPDENKNVDITIPEAIQGEKGETGATPTLVTGTTTTLPAGSEATSSITPTGNENEYAINIGVPKGADGENGSGTEYELPVATSTTLGGIKVDNTSITVDENGVASANVTVDSETLKPLVTEYMEANPVSAEVGDGSVTISKLASDAKEYLGYTEDLVLNNRSDWSGNLSAGADYDISTQTIIKTASIYDINLKDITIEKDAKIKIYSDSDIKVFVVKPNFNIGIFKKSASDEFLELEVEANDKLTINKSCDDSRKENNIITAISDANVRIKFNNLEDALNTIKEKAESKDYTGKAINLIDKNYSLTGYFFDTRDSYRKVVASGNGKLTNYIAVQEGENYVVASGTNSNWGIVSFDENLNYKTVTMTYTWVPCTYGGAKTFKIPINYDAVTITEFEENVQYYIYNESESVYESVDTDTETFDSETTYYVHNPIKYIRGTTNTTYHTLDNTVICQGTVCPMTFPSAGVMDYEPNNQFKSMIEDIIDGHGVNELKGLNYMAYGDSQTFGTGATVSYVDLVAERLGCYSFKNYATPGMRISYSYGKGAADSDILSHCIARRLENTPTNVTNYNDYDIVTLSGGINDCTDITQSCGLELGTYEEALTDFKAGTITDTDFYHAMFKSCYWLRKLYTGKRIGIITPPATSFSDVFYSIETAMVKVANRFGIPVYISSQQDGISCDMEDFKPTYSSDGLHPNEVFNEIRARKIAAWIKTL